MIQIIEKSLLRHFGIEKMNYFWSQAMEEKKEDIEFAVRNNQMLVISGAVGSGKTCLFDAAKSALSTENVKFVYVSNYFKEHVNIASIINALILDLSDESPRRDLEARSRQVTRICGKKHVNEGVLISLVIEEAHRIHPNTLRAIKELRESSFAGKSPLFSVILIGHPQLQSSIESRKEAFWRCQTMELNESNGWMNYKERSNFLKVVFGAAITKEAREKVASFIKNPLEMVFYIKKKMVEAKKAGKRIIDSEVVVTSLLELKEAQNLSLNEIAKEAGVSKSTVFDVLHKENHPQKETVKIAIEKLALQRNHSELSKAG